MSRQHYSFWEEGLENQGFARQGVRFYARGGAGAWLKMEEKVIGDVNGDGIVTVADALVIIRALLNDISLPNADLNGDGKLSLVDVIRVIKLISQ